MQELLPGSSEVGNFCRNYIVPTEPIIPRALCEIFPLLPQDIPEFDDRYRSQNGRWASNKYGTRNPIRQGIQHEFGARVVSPFFPLNFSFFQSSLAENRTDSIPYLLQGRYPIGSVLNGPWLTHPSLCNFTTCSATVKRGCQHFPHNAGFAMLLPFPEGRSTARVLLDTL